MEVSAPSAVVDAGCFGRSLPREVRVWCFSLLWSPLLPGMKCETDHRLPNSPVMLLWLDPESKPWDCYLDMLVILVPCLVLCLKSSSKSLKGVDRMVFGMQPPERGRGQSLWYGTNPFLNHLLLSRGGRFREDFDGVGSLSYYLEEICNHSIFLSL